ncbi:hypothetical protein HDV06_002211 [Boothiomyces sp. JEL0866]|nr:hypothetical protein HDV06_002211 [Boothiomyces sp. JEL0866]
MSEYANCESPAALKQQIQQSNPVLGCPGEEPNIRKLNNSGCLLGISESLPLDGSVEHANAQRLADYVIKMDELRKTSGTQGFKNTVKQESETILNSLYQETREIEKNVFIGEVEVLKKNEIAFFTNYNELEIIELKSHQEEELNHLKIMQGQLIKDFEARKLAKLNSLKQQREMKMLYLETQYRAKIAQVALEDKQRLTAHHQKTAQFMKQIEERHAKQIVQFNAAEDRGYKNKKLLLELQCASMSAEERSEAEKKFQARLNHQKVIHKKRLEHTLEQQRLELRQFKEKSDKRANAMEKMSYCRSSNVQVEQDLLVEQKKEHYAAKDKIVGAKKSLKMMDLKYHYNVELSKLKSFQRNRIRELVKEHKDIFASRNLYWDHVLGKENVFQEMGVDNDLGSSNGHSRNRSNQSYSGFQSKSQSNAHSRKGSNSNLRQMESQAKDNDATENITDDQNSLVEKDTVSKLQNQLLELKKKHNEQLLQLKSDNQKAYDGLNEQLKSELSQMELNHDVERKRYTLDAENEIAELVQNQEKEIDLENHIREAETKALIERKVLINMLDTFTDGVISIDNCGFIKRFNYAAEQMFGYTANEIFGNNMNIKALMPKEHAAKHDAYLYNYFTTGVKKVLGKGNKLFGVKKDGTKFPIYLSLSEVVESGFHQFTAIIRDLTAEVEAENYKQSTETQMIWSIDRNGKVLSLNKRFKTYVGITTKEQEESASVFSEDVVHPHEYQLGLDIFAKANRELSPFEIKRRLKSASGEYRWFLTKALPVFDTKGKFKQWYGACTDIDDAVNLEAELNTLQEKLPVFIWKSDLHGEIFYGNNSFSKYTGIDFGRESTMFYSEKVFDI